MSYVSSQKNLLSKDLKNFITAVTGFEEGTPEFSTFENNAWSTILYYNCPSLNKSSITSRLYGLVEKFKIHAYSFPQKAKNLEMLYKRYIELNGYEEEVKWNLLQLLLLTSRRPTEARDDDPPIKFPLCCPEPNPDTAFDWGAYLKQDLPDYRLPSSHSEDSGSDGEEKELRSTRVAIYQASWEIMKQRQGSNMTNNSDLSYPFVTPDTQPVPPNFDLSCTITRISSTATDTRTMEDTVKERAISEEKCSEIIQALKAHQRTHPIWWADPSFSELAPSKMKIANACTLWEKSMSSRGVCIEKTRILTETKAMKQLLWLLTRPSSYLIVKKSQDGIYKPQARISISSTNPVDFYNTFSEVCIYLPIIEKLNRFVEIIEEAWVDGNRCSKAPWTYFAYAGALKDFLNAFRVALSLIEAFINQQEYIYMLSFLLTEVRPWLHVIKSIYSVHCKAVPDNWKNQENWIISSWLLTVLNNSIDLASGWEKVELTQIFLKTLKPYLEILQTWLVCTKCVDLQDEFLIKRTSTSACEGKLIVRDYKSQLLFYNISNTQFLDDFVYYSIRACSSIDFKIVLNQNVEKDVDLKLIFGQSEICKKDSFYIGFLKSLISEIEEDGIQKDDLLAPNLELLQSKYRSLQKHRDEVERKNQLNSNLLCKNTSALSQDRISSVISSKIDSEWSSSFQNVEAHQGSQLFDEVSVLLSRLEKVDADSIDIASLIRKNFNQVISDMMQPQGFARDPLLKDYKLLDHLAVLKCVFFFWGGAAMTIFTKTLFSKVLSNSLNTISWASELKDLIYENFPVYSSNFVLNLPHRLLVLKKFINNSDIVFPDFIDFSQHIVIDYLIEPPLDLVITSESLERYNEMFHLLLQNKWALSCLSNLSFKDLPTSKRSTLAARLISVRMFLLHNICTLERYFISISSEDFDAEITQVCSVARDVQVIANAHEKILNQRRKRCFLQGSPKIMESILFLFQLCQSLMALWKLSLEHCELKMNSELSIFESLYQDCIHELAEALLQLGKDRLFKNNVNFNFLCDEIFNNMPGDWECH